MLMPGSPHTAGTGTGVVYGGRHAESTAEAPCDCRPEASPEVPQE
jgi:hypothetical protein